MSIDLSTPLTTTHAGANNRYPARGKNHRPFSYDDKLAAIAEAWNVAPDSLINPTLANALAEVADLESQREELKPEPVPSADELAQKNASQRAALIKKIATANNVKSEQRKLVDALLVGARELIHAAQDSALTFDHVRATLPVDAEVERLQQLTRFLADYACGGFTFAVRTGEDDPNRQAVDEVYPMYIESLHRILSLDLLVREADSFALFCDPGISGPLPYHFNVSVTGKVIGKVLEYGEDDLVAHRRAKDYREIFNGGTQRGLTHDIDPTNEYSAISSGDRTVSPLARGKITGLELSIPATWSEFQDRLERFSQAGFDRENVDARTSVDVFTEETTTTSKNKGTGEVIVWGERRNLRTHELERRVISRRIEDGTW